MDFVDYSIHLWRLERTEVIPDSAAPLAPCRHAAVGPAGIALPGHAPPFFMPLASSGNYTALLNNLALTQPSNSEATVATHTTLTLTNNYVFPQYYLHPCWEPGPPQLSSPPPLNENYNPSTAGCSPHSQSEIQLKQTLFCCHPVRKHYNTWHIRRSWRQNNSH